MKKIKKIFISGKITGEPPEDCIDKFYKARYELLLKYGVQDSKIIIPLKIQGIHFGISHEDAMKLCFNALKTCTHIYMLKDWELSRGAKMEHDMAKEYGLEIIYE